MSFTIVTALIDINRSEWNTVHKRQWSTYLSCMENILRIDAPMHIYVEKKTVEFVKECRKNFKSTEIIPISIEDYVLYPYLEHIRNIQSQEKYQGISIDKFCPEIIEPLYDVVVNNKVRFMHNSSTINSFNTKYFIWLDAGYGHNTFNIPIKHTWNPLKYLEFASQDVIVINNLIEHVSSENYLQFFKDHMDFIDGGMIVGTKLSIERLNKVYYNIIEEIMEQGIIDDDQYFMTMAYVRNKDLFKLIHIPNWGYRKQIILGDGLY